MGRYIDADELIDAIPNTSVDIFENCRNCKLLDKEEIVSIINEISTVDTVEIVRCKECKHWEGTEQGGFYYFEHCALTGLDMIYDDFCSRGERR